MSFKKVEELAAAVVVYLLYEEDEEPPVKRACWVDEMHLTREREGMFAKLNNELRRNPQKFKNYVRMSPEHFDSLVHRVTPYIAKQDTNYRKAIGPGERLAVTLRYLASGSSMVSLSYSFRMSTAVITKIIPETCNAIYQTLKGEYLKMPTTATDWQKVADEFESRWNFPNCVGALDGKHINIQAPPRCGSSFFNYKGTNSIVLMAMADAEYKFSYIDVGAYGRDSDGGVFSRCSLSGALSENHIHLPPPRSLPGRCDSTPFVVVADDAFPLKPYLMKPFPFRKMTESQRIYNYRLSRARRIIENVFGICAARFRLLRRPIDVNPESVTTIVLAICALHNFLVSENGCSSSDFDTEVDGTITPGNWRRTTRNTDDGSFRAIVATQYGGRCLNAIDVRTQFASYFSSAEGAVSWQKKACGIEE